MADKYQNPMKTVMTSCALLALVSCANTPPNFRQMSDEELPAYNSSVPIVEQVYCREEIQIGSHIRQRVCVKIQDLLDGTITTLNTASSSTSVPYHRQ